MKSLDKNTVQEITKLYFKNRILFWLILVLIVLIFYYLNFTETGKKLIIPKTTTVYAKTDIKLSNKDHTEHYKKLDPIEIVEKKNSDKLVVYKYDEKIGIINKDSVFFEDSEEYIKLKEKKEREEKERAQKAEIARKKAEQERLKKERIEQQKIAKEKAKELADLENTINHAFVEVSINDFGGDVGGVYEFYTYPQTWHRLSYEEKKNVLVACQRYIMLKTGASERKAQVGTRIKSAFDGSELATVVNIR